MTGFVTVGKVEDFPMGRLRRVEVDGKPIAVTQVDGIFYAMSDICPHFAGLMSEGYATRELAVCIYHGATLDLKTGAVRQGPANKALPIYNVRVEAGEVQVEPPAPEGKSA